MENSATSGHVDVVSLQQENDGDRGCGATAGASDAVDDPNTMISALAEAAGAGSGNGSINGSSYWASIMNGLMAHNNNNNTSSGSSSVTGAVNPPLVAISAAVGTNVVPAGAAAAVTASSPSSSSVHIDHQSAAVAANNIDMLGSLANDPDSAAVWAQDFLHGSIAEVKPSIHACSDDGLQELLYPSRTMRELLYSDHNQILNQAAAGHQPTATGTGAPTASSSSWEQLILPSPNCNRPSSNAYNPNPNFPIGEMGADQMASHLGVNMDMAKTGHALLHHHHHHYPHLDDRLSSTTPASSTLSDNTTSCTTLDQWPSAQCEHNPSPVARTNPNRLVPSPSPAALLHPFDQSRVKQEYNQLQQNPNLINTSSYGKPTAMGSISPFQLLHQQQQQMNQRNQLINIPAKSEPVANSYDNCGLIDQKPTIAKPQQQQGQILWPNQGSNPAAAFHHGLQQNPGPDSTQLLANFSAAPGLSNAGGLEVNNYFQPELIQQVQSGGLINAAADRRMNPNAAASMSYNLQNMGKKPRHLEGGQVEDAKELVPSDQKPNIIPGSTCEKQQQLSEEYNMKRPRVEQTPSSSTTSFKSQPVRKEKLGERITTLQQLVAPFGKTDTASVLLEAIGYIKFLQEQVQALSSPYFKSSSANSSVQNGDGEEAKPDLRSRGLCLVPLSCTMHVANDNGADYWFGGTYR